MAVPDYEPIPDSPFLKFEARQMPYERTCFGCQQEFDEQPTWNETNQCLMFGAMLVGPFRTVITDQSGSEQCITHNDERCINKAISFLSVFDDLTLEGLEDE